MTEIEPNVYSIWATGDNWNQWKTVNADKNGREKEKKRKSLSTWIKYRKQTHRLANEIRIITYKENDNDKIPTTMANYNH